MTDAEIALSLLRRFVEAGGYWCFGADFLTIDGRIKITAEESAALERMFGRDGQGWWDKSVNLPQT